jgi:UDP-N-acetylmuramate dehydrogenase
MGDRQDETVTVSPPKEKCLTPSAKQLLFSGLGRNLHENVPLAPLTTIKIGGPAALFFPAPTADDLVEAIELAFEANAPYWLLGGGSNLVISDEGLPGLVIVDSNRTKLEVTANRIVASSGMALAEVVEACRKRGLSGFEFAAGIPGSVGGAVCGNAGAYGSTVGDRLVEAEIWTPDGRTETVGREFFQFDYRESVFKRTDGIVLSATFEVEPGDPERIEAVIQQNLRRRWERLPSPELPSAGSFFKNLPPERPGEHRRAAGQFLEQAGAKSLRVGNARVFEKHANIIVNMGGARASEVKELAHRMKSLVRDKFGIALEEEARLLGRVE